ncbi:hypothetical protein D3C80_2094070 [compost metagenome]
MQVTLLVAVSRPTTLVRPITPCLAATYAALPVEPTKPCTEAILTIRPQLRARMPGKARRVP